MNTDALTIATFATMALVVVHMIAHAISVYVRTRSPKLADRIDAVDNAIQMNAPKVLAIFAAPSSDAKVTPISPRKTDPTTIPPTAASILILGCALALGVHLSGCGGSDAWKADLQTGIDDADLACRLLSLQDEPQAVKYGCQAIEAGRPIGDVLLVRKPKAAPSSSAAAATSAAPPK